jgi:TolB protein
MRLTPLRGRQRGAAATAVVVTAIAVSMALAGCGARSAGSPGATTAGQSAGSTQPTSSTQPPLGTGQVGTLAQVPWGDIGPGWAVAEFTTGSHQVAGPVTLYLVDPEGGRYQLRSLPATTQPWVLMAWSGDKTRVLLQEVGTSQLTLHQLTLATGQMTTFTLPQGVTQVLGYTRPDGENILVQQDGVVRYSLTGVLQARLSSGPQDAWAVSSPDGLTEVVSAGTGVDLVSNAGSLIRFLAVPGTDATTGGCTPERWWNTADVLVACTPSGAIGPQVWLVPVSGAAPSALTPVRTAPPDFGDVDAWQLPTGLYLQAEAGCGPPFIAEQVAGGGIQAVSGGSASSVIATAGDSMLVQQSHECAAGSSLAWFNPATSAVQPVLTAPANSTGVISAFPYDGDGEQP